MQPPWLRRAIKEIGVKEDPSSNSTSRIVEYFQETSFKSTNDEHPWCAAFLCWCLEREGVPSPRSARARDFLTWGVSIGKPLLGCIVVLKRGNDPNQGHVGFLMHETLNGLAILGGNQKNQVCVVEFSRDLVIGYRMPDEDYWEDEYEDSSTDTRYS